MEEVKNTGRVVDISMINFANGERMCKNHCGHHRTWTTLKLHCTYHRNWGCVQRISVWSAIFALRGRSQGRVVDSTGMDLLIHLNCLSKARARSTRSLALCRGNVRRTHFCVLFFHEHCWPIRRSCPLVCTKPSATWSPAATHLSLGDFKRLRLLKTLWHLWWQRHHCVTGVHLTIELSEKTRCLPLWLVFLPVAQAEAGLRKVLQANEAATIWTAVHALSDNYRGLKGRMTNGNSGEWMGTVDDGWFCTSMFL